MNAITSQQDFSSSTQTMAVVETASTAIAAQAKAMVESRYIMAMRNPRNMDQVRTDLIKECSRPSFANNPSAFYIKPIGKGVEGLGIRFAEVALRCMRNVLIETTMIFEDAAKEVHRVSVTDLEANITYPLDVRVSKTVERSKPLDDGSYISVRMNSYNKPVYTVPATDDDLLNKRGALISKAMRTISLRIIPGDLQDECEAIIKKVRLNEAARDPDAERKKIVDAFSVIGVSAINLTKYLGHDIGGCSPAEMVVLRAIYGAIKDGETTWKSVMDNKVENDDSPKDKQTYPDEQFKKSLAAWSNLIQTGKKTPDEIIKTAESKFPLTDAQKKAIRDVVLQQEKPTDVPAITYAQVADQLNKAKDTDLLDAAADLIGEIADEQQRKELGDIYNVRRLELEGA